MWLSLSVRKQPHPPRAQGNPVGTCPHQTPQHSDYPATGNPHQVNKYLSALPPSPPPVPPRPEKHKQTGIWSKKSWKRWLTMECFMYVTVPSYSNIAQSPHPQWGTGHQWWKSWDHWDWATTSAGRLGSLSAATLLHTFLWVVPQPSGAWRCRSELGLAPRVQQQREKQNPDEDYYKSVFFCLCCSSCKS